MYNIASFLERFKRILSSQGVFEGVVVDVVGEMFGDKLDKKNISLHNGVVYINTSQNLKTSIFIKKQEVISQINKHVGGSKVRDIR